MAGLVRGLLLWSARMISCLSTFIAFLFINRRCMPGMLVIGVLLFGRGALDAAVIHAQSASRTDVGAAVALAKDGDTVTVPAGTATWTATLSITKNITLQGAGEGQTMITENLPRAANSPIFSVSLSHDSSAPAYSFRLTGMKLKSANNAALSSDHAFIMVTGLSHYVANPTTDLPAPHILGCVSRVRIDHMTWDNLNGLALLVDSCLGVADHITQTTTTSVYQSYPIKVFANNWTPALNPATGLALPTSYLATKSFGSWADDPYWGTDKFFFFEDCNFTVPSTTNVADCEEGARVVFRHSTFNGGGGLASHGVEGRAQPGIKQEEVYNNYFVTNRLFGQLRSGSSLYFNNKSTAMTKGRGFYIYRQTRTETNWGAADGTDRYDNNGPLVYSGKITNVGPGYPNIISVSDTSKANFNLINLTDGSAYSINDLDDPAGGSTMDAGWKTKHTTISSVNGTTLTVLTDNGTSDSTFGNYAALWKIGHRYEIRRVLAIYGQPGQGKGDLLNSGTSYNTYPYPATSGTNATYPQAGYPLEPCYSWNNTDNTYGYLGFDAGDAGKNNSLKTGRDYFNLSERAIATQDVGFPSQTYARATNSYPKIGLGQTVAYTPYIYPHPLTVDGGSAPIPPGAPSNLKINPAQ